MIVVKSNLHFQLLLFYLIRGHFLITSDGAFGVPAANEVVGIVISVTINRAMINKFFFFILYYIRLFVNIVCSIQRMDLDYKGTKYNSKKQ